MTEMSEEDKAKHQLLGILEQETGKDARTLSREEKFEVAIRLVKTASAILDLIEDWPYAPGEYFEMVKDDLELHRDHFYDLE